MDYDELHDLQNENDYSDTFNPDSDQNIFIKALDFAKKIAFRIAHFFSSVIARIANRPKVTYSKSLTPNAPEQTKDEKNIENNIPTKETAHHDEHVVTQDAQITHNKGYSVADDKESVSEPKISYMGKIHPSSDIHEASLFPYDSMITALSSGNTLYTLFRKINILPEVDIDQKRIYLCRPTGDGRQVQLAAVSLDDLANGNVTSIASALYRYAYSDMMENTLDENMMDTSEMMLKSVVEASMIGAAAKLIHNEAAYYDALHEGKIYELTGTVINGYTGKQLFSITSDPNIKNQFNITFGNTPIISISKDLLLTDDCINPNKINASSQLIPTSIRNEVIEKVLKQYNSDSHMPHTIEADSQNLSFMRDKEHPDTVLFISTVDGQSETVGSYHIRSERDVLTLSDAISDVLPKTSLPGGNDKTQAGLIYHDHDGAQHMLSPEAIAYTASLVIFGNRLHAVSVSENDKQIGFINPLADSAENRIKAEGGAHIEIDQTFNPLSRTEDIAITLAIPEKSFLHPVHMNSEVIYKTSDISHISDPAFLALAQTIHDSSEKINACQLNDKKYERYPNQAEHPEANSLLTTTFNIGNNAAFALSPQEQYEALFAMKTDPDFKVTEAFMSQCETVRQTCANLEPDNLIYEKVEFLFTEKIDDHEKKDAEQPDRASSRQEGTEKADASNGAPTQDQPILKTTENDYQHGSNTNRYDNHNAYLFSEEEESLLNQAVAKDEEEVIDCYRISDSDTEEWDDLEH